MRLHQRFPVPSEIGLLYDFLNSLDLRSYVEGGVPHVPSDEFATADSLQAWLEEHGLVRPGGKIGESEHREVLALRAGFRARLGAGRARTSSAGLNAALQRYPLVVQADDAGMKLEPASGVQTAGLGLVVAEFFLLHATGRLDRLKTCESEDCSWMFFDRSKPANRRWCSTELCGNRHKTRAYRRRAKQP